MWRLLLPMVLLPLTACGASDHAASPEDPADTTQPADLPSSYSYDLTSSCGERDGLGSYHIVVDGGVVTGVQTRGGTKATGLDPADFPSLADLEQKAGGAGPDAKVDLGRGPGGMLSSLKIDPVPSAIDDEECYRITRFTPIH